MEKLLNDYKISFTKGDTYALAVKFKNITSDLGSAYFTVKENADDEPLIQKSLGAGVTKIDDRAYKQEKTYKIQLQSEDTADLEPLVQYLYDFRVAFGNVVQTILSGIFVMKHSVTDVSTTSTTTLDVTLSDVLESEASTTPPTQGIEYEQDPVANAKIGDLTGLSTTNKETLVKAINEVNKNAATANSAIRDILNGTQSVPDAENADYASRAGTSDNAYNVTDAIGDVPLSQIFESDNKTVKNATNAKKSESAKILDYGVVSIPLTTSGGYIDKIDNSIHVPYNKVPKGLYIVGYGEEHVEFFLTPLYIDGDDMPACATAYVPESPQSSVLNLYDLETFVNMGVDWFQADFYKTSAGEQGKKVRTGYLFFIRIGGTA